MRSKNMFLWSNWSDTVTLNKTGAHNSNNETLSAAVYPSVTPGYTKTASETVQPPNGIYK